MKKVPSKVIKSGPFVERRLRNDSSKNKYRRSDDMSPQNISPDSAQDGTESQTINSATYKDTSGKPKTPNQNCPRGRLLDFYA